MTKARKRTVYVSSTFTDLKAHRDALTTALERAQYDVDAMEKYPAFDQRPLDKCLADVAAADVYVLLLAHRYGFRPKEKNPAGKSITRLEYEEAGRHTGKPRFVFTVDLDHPWSPKWIDKGKDARDLEAFRTAVEQQHGVSRFTDPDQLASLVLQALRAAESSAGHPATETALQRALIDFSPFIADKARGFVGRRFVFDAIDAFLGRAPSGYFVLRGEPGIGKSAIMAQLAQTRQYPHHFNIASEGIGSAKQFFLNASVQLIAQHRLDDVSLPDDAGADNTFFKRILAAASNRSPRVVLLIDALDEATDPLASARANPLQLPASLPANVFILASTRRTSRQLTAELTEVFELDAASAPNLQDIEEYIEAFAARPPMRARLDKDGIDVRDFVRMLVDKSGGNFMYLHHVLPAIEDGRLATDRRLDLPAGLEGYYRSHWESMRGNDLDMFRRVNQKIVACLATAHRPITPRFIARVTDLSLAEVQWTVERWREFLHESRGKDGPAFRIYHASYRDFLAEQVVE